MSKSSLILWIIALSLGLAAVHFARQSGKDSVQKEWNKAIIAEEQAKSSKVERITIAKDVYHEKTDDLVEKAKVAQQRAEDSLRTQRSMYERRLRDSASRAEVYQRMSEASAIEQQRLADHAAKLDRSLEEGRQLVGELRSTLELRDEQIVILATQIQNDRELLSTE